METERFVACAKINLGLEVLYKRADGYHELNTVFYRVMEPHDSIVVTPAEVFQLTCSQESLPTDSRNLMMRAAELFAILTREPLPPIHVHLEKHIPMGAGLGGGSSDAAVMLEILRDRAKNKPTVKDLDALAARIGADVPFFLSGHRAAIAQGIGDILSPIDYTLPCSILIVKHPEVAVPTAEAYAGLRLQETSSTDFASLFSEEPDLSRLKHELRNDFEPSVFEQYPPLQEIKSMLVKGGAAVALMSGSGSSIFGLFEDRTIALELKGQCEREGLLAFLG